MKTAILVDGDFFLRRHYSCFGKELASDPKQVAKYFWGHCIKHLDKDKDQLYRIFFYDCPPLDKKLQHPLSGKPIDLMRNVALRLGYLDDANGAWRIKDAKANKKVISGQVDPKTLDESDFVYHATQKGVDMKIGLDIAALAYKRLVERIVLIAGDSDFVPTAKLARREGIEFILDPIRNRIRLDLQEHIDGLKTTLPKNPSTPPAGNEPC